MKIITSPHPPMDSMQGVAHPIKEHNLLTHNTLAASHISKNPQNKLAIIVSAIIAIYAVALIPASAICA
jgi:hypothetical protein